MELPIEILYPGIAISLFFLVIIMGYAVYLIYFALTIRRKQVKHTYFPFVSVLVYATNAGNIIGRIIKNLIEQNYPNSKYEIIVYDNASSDETQQICEKYAKKYKMVKYVRAAKKYDRKGPFLDYVIGNHARGEILLMTDPDVIAEETWILDIVQPFKNPEVGSVAGTIHCGNYYKGFIPLMRAIEDEWRFVAPMLRNSEYVFSVGANQALRREAWQQTKYGKDVLDDLDILSRIIGKGWKCVGTSATGVEEEVEDVRQYWNQRTRWYKLNPNHFGKRKKWHKFVAVLPHAIQLFALGLIIIFFATYNYPFLLYFVALDFVLLNLAMAIAFLKIKTGKGFIPFIPIYLTIDTLMFAVTAIYVQTLGRFIHLTKEVWPSLKGYYYHAGTELKTGFFKFEQKVVESFRQN